MIGDIIGEWDVTLVEKGKETPAGRIVFASHDGKVTVRDADPDAASRPARVDVEGETIRFEFLSAGSSRGNTHHNFELRMQGPDVFAGTRRRGMLAKTFVTGQRVGVAPGVLALTSGPVQVTAGPDAAPDSLAAAKARAAEAAERASLAAAEAAAALAEAEAVAALEGARRAAERAAAARAATTRAVRTPVAPEVLATLPAPTDPPAFVPLAPVAQAAQAEVVEAPDADVEPSPHAPGRRLLGITHRLTYGDSAVLAAEAFPGVFVWGGTFAAPEQRLREAGWEIVAVDTDEAIEVDGLLIQHAAMIRDTVSG